MNRAPVRALVIVSLIALARGVRRRHVVELYRVGPQASRQEGIQRSRSSSSRTLSRSSRTVRRPAISSLFPCSIRDKRSTPRPRHARRSTSSIPRTRSCRSSRARCSHRTSSRDSSPRPASSKAKQRRRAPRSRRCARRRSSPSGMSRPHAARSTRRSRPMPTSLQPRWPAYGSPWRMAIRRTRFPSLSAILSADPENEEALVQKAEIEVALGRTAEGIATLRQAVAAAPDKPLFAGYSPSR